MSSDSARDSFPLPDATLCHAWFRSQSSPVTVGESPAIPAALISAPSWGWGSSCCSSDRCLQPPALLVFFLLQLITIRTAAYGRAEWMKGRKQCLALLLTCSAQALDADLLCLGPRLLSFHSAHTVPGASYSLSVTFPLSTLTYYFVSNMNKLLFSSFSLVFLRLCVTLSCHMI